MDGGMMLAKLILDIGLESSAVALLEVDRCGDVQVVEETGDVK
jgi:hypothetical protein